MAVLSMQLCSICSLAQYIALLNMQPCSICSLAQYVALLTQHDSLEEAFGPLNSW